MYMCTLIYIYACKHINLCTRMHIQIHVCMHTHAYTREISPLLFRRHDLIICILVSKFDANYEKNVHVREDFVGIIFDLYIHAQEYMLVEDMHTHMAVHLGVSITAHTYTPSKTCKLSGMGRLPQRRHRNILILSW
jgi:hypothetical protein